MYYRICRGSTKVLCYFILYKTCIRGVMQPMPCGWWVTTTRLECRFLPQRTRRQSRKTSRHLTVRKPHFTERKLRPRVHWRTQGRMAPGETAGLWQPQPALPEAVCVPISIQGLEVLAIIDPLAAACTHRQLTSCRGEIESGAFLRGAVWCRSNLHCPPHVAQMPTCPAPWLSSHCAQKSCWCGSCRDAG